jgi:sugar phosphate isomerase/epimerase
MSDIKTRRDFIKSAGIGFAFAVNPVFSAGMARQPGAGGKETADRIKFGLASFTFREFSLEDTIKMTLRCGLKHIALKSFHLALESSKEEIRSAAEKVRSAGLDLYGCSVVVLNNEDEVNQVFEYAKTAGMRMIIAQPVAGLLEIINKKVKEYDIMFAIHNHGPEDKNFPVPQVTMEKIAKLDRRIGLCIDIGHVRRSGVDPSEAIERCAGRLIDIHIKDIRSVTQAIDPIEVGRGILDIPGVLRTILKINYSGIVSLEYEKDGKDPLPGATESMGYIRGILSVI